MEGIEEAKLMNQVMDYLLNHKHMVDSYSLFANMGEPMKSHDHFMELLEKMKQIKSKAFELKEIKTMDVRLMIGITAFTEDFKNEGGFVHEYNKYKEAAIKINEGTSQDKRIKDLTEQNLRLSNQLKKQKIKTHWIPIGISIVSLLGSIIIPIVISSMKQPNQSDRIRLDIVEGKIGKLRKEYQQKNDSLYEEMMKLKLLTQPYVINPLSGDTLQKPH